MKPLRLPWTATAAALIAFATLTLSGGGSIALPLLALGLLATYITDSRMDDRGMAHWTVRVIVFGVALFSSVGKKIDGSDWLVNSSLLYVVGVLCAAELVIQAWLTRPGSDGMGIILLSGIAYIAAGNTYNQALIRYTAPFFILFTALSIRAFRPRRGAEGDYARHRGILALGLSLLLFAFFLGVGAQYELWANRNNLMQLGANWLSNQSVPPTTGISSYPQLEASFDVQLPPTRVLRIEGPCLEQHIRVAAFDSYLQGRWGPPREDRTFLHVSPAAFHPTAAGPRSRFVPLADLEGPVLLPLHAAGFMLPPAQIDWDAQRGGAVNDPDLGQHAYQVAWGQAEETQGPLCVPLDAQERARCLQVPREIDPQVKVLAHRVSSEQQPPDRRVDAVVRYLMSHHSYSLTYNPPQGDPVSRFLLTNGAAAHCQYFASGAAILLRCLGVPARYVSGFYAHESDWPGSITVRQRDAHAWVECWIDGTGWITVDATPGSGRPDALVPAPSLWQKCWEWIQDRFDVIRAWLATLSPLQFSLLMIGIGGLMLLYLRWRLWDRKRQSIPPAFEYFSRDGGLAAAADQFERLLAAHGVPCPPHRTWQEHLAILEAAPAPSPANGSPTTAVVHRPGRENPSALPTLDMARARLFVQEYNAARFGAADPVQASENLWRLLQEIQPPSKRHRKRQV